jgi:putative Holliday junction resolvase
MEKYPILAIDYGEKHFGLSISDSKGIIASPLEVVSITKNRDINTVIKNIIDICTENRVKRIVVGMPQIFTKKQNKSKDKVDNFISLLEATTDIPIITYDETFSTSEAENMLISSGQNSKSYRSKIDKVAATVFLQEFLNLENNKNEKR